MNEDPNINIIPQPLDTVLTELKLNNADVVSKSTEQLTHKQVQKARKGRKVTPNIQSKILHALNACFENRTFTKKDLFTY